MKIADTDRKYLKIDIFRLSYTSDFAVQFKHNLAPKMNQNMKYFPKPFPGARALI
jgi:hypothetical protein